MISELVSVLRNGLRNCVADDVNGEAEKLISEPVSVLRNGLRNRVG